jgi:hypothetical protein
MYRRLILLAVAVALVGPAAVASTALAGGGNSLNAKSCQKNGWMSLVSSSGATFASASACVSYAANGGVLKKAQTIGFTSTDPSPVTVGGTYKPTATATSGLTVAITIDAASTGCSLSSGVVSFTASGTCVIDANQAGNSIYNAAAQVQQSIIVNTTVTGSIGSIAADGTSFSVGSTTIEITTATAFGGAGSPASLADLKAGDAVAVIGHTQADGALLAVSVTRFDLIGTITANGSDDIAVSGARVRTSGATMFGGVGGPVSLADLKVGDTLGIDGSIQGDGSFAATLVTRLG